MKKLFLVFFILLTLGVNAFATTVTVGASTQSSFNPSGLSGDVTGITVGVTNNTTTVTSSALFRAAWVGLSGFRVSIGGVVYTVASVDSTSSLVLTAVYAGATGSSTMTVYKYVEMRFYSSISFRPLGSSEIIQVGTPGSSSWFKRIVASIVNVSGVNTLYIPQFTLDSTTDSVDNNQARYTIGFYRPDNSLIQYYTCSSASQLRIPPTTPTSLADICIYNSTQVINIDNTAYTKGQIDARFPSCTSGQMIYYSATGQTQACLSVGANLSINSGTLNASGGAGSLTVKEVDGTPTVAGVSTVRVSNGTLTDDGGSQVTIANTAINPTNGLIPYRDSATSFSDSPLTVTSVSLITTAADFAPSTDNAREFGSGALRFRVIRMGPLGFVAHNDATNTTKVTLGFSSTNARLFTDTTTQLQLAIGTTVGATLDTVGNFVLGNAALSTSATDGFVHMASMAGVPTGVPTTYTGRTPLTVDTSNSRLYGYIGAAWVNLSGAGSVSGSGTTNFVPLWTASTTLGNSVFQQIGTSEFKFSATGKRLNLDTGSQEVFEIANDTVTGTVQDRLAILTGGPSKAIVAGTSNTGGLIGIVVAGAGISGNAQVAIAGVANCEFDGGTAAGQYVIASTTLAGRCANHGASWPTTNIQVIGRVLSTNGGAGTYAVALFGPERRGFTGAGGSTTHVQYNNGGAIAGDAGFTYDGGLAQVTIGQGGTSTGILALRNATNSNNTSLQAGVPSSSLTFTLPATLPASAGCLQVGSTGIITQTGSACGSGGSAPPFIDTTSIVEGSADGTKEIRFEVDGLTTATVRVLTPPDANIVIAGSASALTSTRVPFVTTGGLLLDSADFRYTTGSTQLELGTASSTTGKLRLAVSGDANFSILQAGDAPVSDVTYKWPADDPVAADFLKVTSFSGGVAVLEWAPGGGAGTTINATDTVVPFRSNATTFVDSPLSVVTGRLISTATATASGVAPYLRIITPVDTGQTVDTEFPGIFLGGSATGTTVIRTGADGTSFAVQREVIVQAPTYAFAGATTVTTAATFAIVAAPIAGTNATLTNKYSLWVQAGISNFDDPVSIGAGSSLAADDYILFPFTGGTNSSGPAIRWASSASYATQSSLFLSLGLIWQGADSTHDPFKIRKGTGTSSDGDLVFEFRPSTAAFNLYPYGVSAGNTTEIRFIELAANGSEYVSIKAPDALAATLNLTWLNTLPASAGCLQVSSAGVISQTGSACGSGGSAPPFIDTTSIVEGSADGTKEIRFEVDGLTTATIRVLTPPDANIVIAGSASALTSGRVPFVTTGGLLLDSADFQYTNNRLSIAQGTSPSVPLHVKSDASNFGLRVTGNAAAIDVDVSSDGSVGFVGTTTNHGLDIYTNLGMAIHIDGGTARLVGINATTPGAQLEVTSTANGTIAAQINGTSAATANLLNIRKGTSNRLTFTQDAIMTIGLASTVTGKIALAVSGDADLTTFQAGDTPASAVTYKWPADDPVAADFLKVTSFSGGVAVLEWAAGGGGSSPPFVDTTSIVEGSADATKEIRFEVDGLTTGTVRVLTPQNADYTLAGTNFANTFTEVQTFTPGARSSGVAPYLTVNAPADTALTASTEAIGVSFVGATRQHATGAITTQREYVFAAPTYSFAGASTITTAATLAITGVPVAGTNATITQSAGLLVQNTVSAASAIIVGASSGIGMTISTVTTTPTVLNTANRYALQLQPTGTGLIIVGGTGVNEIWKDSTPTKAMSFGLAVPGQSITNDFIISSFEGSTWVGIVRATNAEGALLVNTPTVAGQLGVVSGAAGRLAQQIESANGATVALSNLIHTNDQTAAVRTHTQFYSRSSSTAATSFGGRLLFGLESSTTNDQDAAAINWLWTDATHASRASALTFSVVTAAGALTEVGRFTQSTTNGQLTLGLASTTTGKLGLAVSGDADVTTIQAGDTPASAVTYKWPADDPAAAEFLKVTSFSGGVAVLEWAAGGGGSSPPFTDTTSIVEGSADATKEIRFEVDGLTTGTVRVLTPQNADYTLAGTNFANTFTSAQIVSNTLVYRGTLAVFSANANEPPASAFATLDTRNAHQILNFDAATDEDAVFSGVMDRKYTGNGLTLTVVWVAATATSGDVVWNAAIERIDAGGLDIDADSFATAQAATCTANGTSGITQYCVITFTSGAQMDSLASGEAFRVKVTRDANAGGDTMTGDASLLRVEIRETP